MRRNVIFLDFDGVLRPIIPLRSIRRPEPDIAALLGERYQNQVYADIDDPTLRNVYYHFYGAACYCIRMLCQIPHTEIVLSTSWRVFYRMEDLIALLNLYRIGEYVHDKTSLEPYGRDKQIQAYLKQHDDIDHYLIIDDINLEQFFPGHVLHCHRYLELKQFHQGYDILTK